ncbi:MAG: protein kinase domain-containing protein [Archangium sp.]
MDPGYELIRRIAGGGMGEVFVARRTGAGNFEKHVALKLLLPHLADSPDLVKRFHDEARLAARMHHPNIVEIFDVGEADGRPFIAMQWVEGVTLGKLLRDSGARGESLPLPIIRLLATSLCEALSYAHGLTDGKGRHLRVVHRDVTPGNVLVSGQGAVLLTDFGIARVRDGSMTEPGVLRGKAAYLAPEQVLHDAPVDARADIYAAALTLYEALTGLQPYRRDSMKDALDAVIKGGVHDVRALREDVSPRMAAALTKALSRKPTERFETAKQFREAFVDGLVATTPELAEFVRKICGDVSKPMLDAVDESGPGATKSVITVTPTRLKLPAVEAAAPEAKKGRAGLISAVVVVVLLISGGGAWWLTRVPEVVAQPPKIEAPVVVAPIVEDEAEPEVVAPVAAIEPEPTPKKTRGPVRRKPLVAPQPAAMRVGYVTADAAPWAEVMLDGKLLDRTPFVRYPLPAGKHTLVFKGPNGATEKRVVSVAEGAVTAVRVEFK